MTTFCHLVRDAEASFDASLRLGQQVTAWWAEEDRCRSARAVVQELFATTVTAKLLEPRGGLPAGSVFELPRYGRPGWSFSHGVHARHGE
jgi:hypothetical protein